MKRIFVSLMAIMIALLYLNTSLAEDFIIHSGVIFGDSKEDVKSKETLDLETERNDCLIYKGRIAGYDSSSVYYNFNEEEKLVDAFYTFPDTLTVSKNTVLQEYADLFEALKEKYGDPISNSDNVYSLILGRKMKNLISNGQYTKIDIEHYAWIAKYDDYNVKIELIYNESKDVARCNIDYHKYTDEDLIKIMEEVENIKKEQSDDL